MAPFSDLSEELFRSVFEASPAGVVLSDEQGRILLTNAEALRIFGYTKSEISERFVEDLIPERFRVHHAGYRKRFIEEGEARAMGSGQALFALAKDGVEIPIEIGLRPLSVGDRKMVLATVIDLSERRQAEKEKKLLEDRLLRAQKMDTIGTLAGGIAHDFNNILTPILGYTEIALANISPSDPLHEYLEEIFRGSTRAAELVQQILLFSRQTEHERRHVQLEAVVLEALKLVRPAIPATVEIRTHLDTPCRNILADSVQVHQLVVNLCTNAWQAMQDGGGTLTLSLESVEVDAATAELYPNLRVESYARLSVADTGSGIDPETLEQIFEPFFTTKEVGSGTGLGLSIVHGIVRAHEGEIIVYSEPGQGTTFHVYLPLARGGDSPPEPSDESFPEGHEAILVLDDDAVVRDTIKVMLGGLGYSVGFADSSPTAWAALQVPDQPYDLVLSDLTMPQMSGLELAEHLKTVHPDLPVVVMSGYGGDISEFDELENVRHVLKKPLTRRALAHAVRNSLDAQEAENGLLRS